MSQPSPDEDGRESRQRPRPGSLGSGMQIARWGMWAWSAGSVLMPAIIVCAAGALVFLCVFAVSGVWASTVKEDVERNCDEAIGPDPSASTTATAPAAAAPATEQAEVPVSASATPTANPYASLEPDEDSSARLRECFKALKDAPFYGPPIGTANRSAAAPCAAKLAVGQVGRQGFQASLVKYVVYHASMTSLTGYCEPPPPEGEPPADEMVPTVDLPTASTCPKSTKAMVMPDTVVAQGICGQPVALDSEAVSGGDLVFWGHRDDDPTGVGPTRVGVAISPTEAISSTELVTVDETGFVVRQAIPKGSDTRVKRVLPESD